MKKRETRIFTDEIKVPEIVQRKADAAFAQIQRERAETMKKENERSMEIRKKGNIGKAIKIMAAVAACAVLMTAIGYGSKSKNSNLVMEENGSSQIAETPVKSNMFTMTAYAQELEPGKSVLLTDVGNSGRSSVFSGSEDGSVSYCISTEFLCQGENIERVGYSINRGAFQIVQPITLEDRIVIEGQTYNGELNTGSIGGDYDESLEVLPQIYETTLYQSFQLDYDRQSAENTWINICNECPDNGEILNLMWGEGTTLEDENNGINKMLDGTVITCTAYYVDGTSSSVNIEVGSRVMTYEEAGEPYGKGEIPGNTKSTFIIFEMK